MTRLVLLDRDGVLNADHPEGVREARQLIVLPGAAEAVAKLSRHGFRIAVVTNQSVIGKGLASREQVEQIHGIIAAGIQEAGGRIDAFYVCPDHPDRPTPRRKPAPGMLLEALADFGASASATPFVGDDVRDLQAARAAGCPSYLVLTGKGPEVRRQGLHRPFRPVMVAETLGFAVDDIIGRFG